MQENIFMHRVSPRLLMDVQAELLREKPDITILGALLTRIRINLINTDVLLSGSDAPLCFAPRHVFVAVHGDEGRGLSVAPVEMLCYQVQQGVCFRGEIHIRVCVFGEDARVVDVARARRFVFNAVENVWSRDRPVYDGFSVGLGCARTRCGSSVV